MVEPVDGEYGDYDEHLAERCDGEFECEGGGDNLAEQLEDVDNYLTEVQQCDLERRILAQFGSEGETEQPVVAPRSRWENNVHAGFEVSGILIECIIF